MSHLEKILDETFGKEKPKQVEVAVERLHPPMAPIASEKSVLRSKISDLVEKPSNKTGSKPAIDFNAIANASEFRRFIYWIRTGQVFRGSNEKLTIELNKTQEELEIIKAIPKYKEFTGVIDEFKAKLAKIKERRVKS